MPNIHGDWIWYELMTPDADASAAFYAPLMGWTIGSQPEYREIAGPSGEGVGGILPLNADMIAGGCVPAWVGYLNVDEVDAAAAVIETAGGRVLMPARDMPGVGRFAMVADPQGAAFYIMKPTPAADKEGYSSQAFAKHAPKLGHCAWNELYSTDPDAALKFYASQFGWAKDGEMEMGPLGTYSFVKSDVIIGAVMRTMPGMTGSAWTFYFRVGNIDAAVETIKANGGKPLEEPVEIPGGEFSLNAIDPQGAHFAVIGTR